jgi:hypothetical protein
MADSKKKKCLRKKRKRRCAKKADRARIITMTTTIVKIHEELAVDGRCKHGLTEQTCAYCQGMPITHYACSVGMAFIR